MQSLPQIRVIIENFKSEIIHHYDSYFQNVKEVLKIELDKNITQEIIVEGMRQEFQTTLHQIIRDEIRSKLYSLSHTEEFKNIILQETKKELGIKEIT